MHGPTGIFWANLTPFTLQDPEAAERRQVLEAAGAVIIGCMATAAGKVDLADALRRLPAEIHSVMVEGGATVISSLLAGATATSGRVISDCHLIAVHLYFIPDFQP
jgi:riboflavin biosynthesis pyrimidine reductase